MRATGPGGMTDRSILHVRLNRPGFAVYGEVFGVLGDITPVVQALPPDSAVLDVTGALPYFRRTPEGLADLIATRLLARFGLDAAIGAGPNRLLAGLAADSCAPGRIRVLAPDGPDTERFLRSRPVEALPGVGPALSRSLIRYGVTTVGELADLPPATVRRIAGASTGRLLHDRANGRDPRTVAPPARPPGSAPADASTPTSSTPTTSAGRFSTSRSTSVPGCAAATGRPGPSNCRSPMPTAAPPPAPGRCARPPPTPPHLRTPSTPCTPHSACSGPGSAR
ncbi:hypothetical protein GCM10025734_80040 [Kitasatospora paranensis]